MFNVLKLEFVNMKDAVTTAVIEQLTGSWLFSTTTHIVFRLFWGMGFSGGWLFLFLILVLFLLSGNS